jgi:calcium-binding protein CML
MGLQRFLKLGRSHSQPNSPRLSESGSQRQSGSQSSSVKSLSKKIFTQQGRPSSSKPDTPRSPTDSFFGSGRSNHNDSSLASSQLVKDLEDVFKKFDANGDGKISWLELSSILSSLGYKATEEEVQKMIKEADRDGDGFIDLQEFIELNTQGIDSASSLKDLRDAFEIFDLDRNGAISSEELHVVLKNLGEHSTIEDCQLMIKGVDCDGNGQVDFEEFKNMMSGST